MRRNRKADSNSYGSRRSAVFPLLCLIAGLALVLASSARARSSCAGKHATIVSNAAKIIGTKAPDVIVAGGGDNAIYGEGGNDLICGGDGDDTIYGGRGNDHVHGGGGDDIIDGERGSDELDGGSGSDHIFGSTGNDFVDGGPGDRDQVDGGPGDDSVLGGAGEMDVLTGGPGADRIEGGPGAHDVASYKSSGGSISANLQSGTVSGSENERLTGVEDVLGGSGSDTLVGSEGARNRLDGGPGDDRLVAAGSGDEAFGGPGDDACVGALASEDSCGKEAPGNGTEVELYRSIADTSSLVIVGTEGADNVTITHSSAGYMVQNQAPGTQVRLGDESSNACTSDQATNSVSCSGEASSILASLGGGADTLTIAASVPSDVEGTIDGGTGADTIHGGAGNDTIYAGEDSDPDILEGAGGDDVIFGLNIAHPRHDSGAARMFGGAGDDLLIGGQPCDSDLFDGGPGANDSASFARVRNSGVFVSATIGGAVLDPDVSGCKAGSIDHSVEKIEGSPGSDSLTGDDSPNKLLGRGGNDILNGMGGPDDCIGGSGSNQAVNCEFLAQIP